MADTVTFNAESRAQVGKGAARATRRLGKVPAVIYGANKDPEPISISPAQLRTALGQPGFFATLFDIDIDGNRQQVLCRDLQVHPVTDVPMHLDFLRVTERTRINLEIQVTFTNEEESPGLKGGGVLNIVRYAVEVVCRAGAIPEDFVADLTGLEVGDSIHISDISLPEGVNRPSPTATSPSRPSRPRPWRRWKTISTRTAKRAKPRKARTARPRARTAPTKARSSPPPPIWASRPCDWLWDLETRVRSTETTDTISASWRRTRLSAAMGFLRRAPSSRAMSVKARSPASA